VALRHDEQEETAAGAWRSMHKDAPPRASQRTAGLLIFHGNLGQAAGRAQQRHKHGHGQKECPAQGEHFTDVAFFSAQIGEY
jgi:hypothetical protein